MGMSLPNGGRSHSRLGRLNHGEVVPVGPVWCSPRDRPGRPGRLRALPRKERPKLIFCGGTAIPRAIEFDGFAEMRRRSTRISCGRRRVAGLIAGGAHPSPVGHADVISTTTHKTLRGPRRAILMSRRSGHPMLTARCFPASRVGRTTTRRRRSRSRWRKRCGQSSPTTPSRSSRTRSSRGRSRRARFRLISGGTDNHLILVDLTGKGVTGKAAAQALDRARITANYNTVPFDRRKPFDPSGIRLGTRQPPHAA